VADKEKYMGRSEKGPIKKGSEDQGNIE